MFDLDYTLWPYFVDCHVTPPIIKKKEHHREHVVDSEGFLIRGYDDVTKILKTLKEHCLEDHQHLAIASRSTTAKLAMESINLLGWEKYFSSFQIYPTNKIRHMNTIKDELKFEKFEDVLFFDDDYSNIKSTSSIGVFAYEVNQNTGVDVKTIMHALEQFANSTAKKSKYFKN